MHDAIVTKGKFVKGQTVFIQGATSGVGLNINGLSKKINIQ